MREIGEKQHVGHAVNLPLETEVGIYILAAVQTPVAAVAEGGGGVVQELFAVGERQVA